MKLQFEKAENGLLPAIVQDDETGKVLMLAYMNKDAFEHTIKTGNATFWSRSRRSLWIKGESSGNTQKVKSVFVDCDEDTILLRVEQIGGAACHNGYNSCFYRELKNNELITVEEPVFNPADVYNK